MDDRQRGRGNRARWRGGRRSRATGRSGNRSARLLATHNDVGNFEISPIARAVKHHQADVFVWHLRLAPNSALGWHTHPGPAIVTVVRGSLGYQHEMQGECVTTWYTAGTGFMDPGFGHVHRAVSRDDGFGG